METPRLDLPAPPIEPPPWLVPRRTEGEGAWYPDELEAQSPPNSVRHVFRALHRLGGKHGRGTYAWQTSIAKMAGALSGRDKPLGNSTVRVALDWLQQRGWIARQPVEVAGEDREMIWCLWLFRARLGDGDLDIGHGLRMRTEDGRIVAAPGAARGRRRAKAGPAAPRPDGAAFRPPGADSCAQEPAPNDSKWISSNQPTLTLGGEPPTETETRLAPGGGGDPDPGTEEATAPPAPPAPPPRPEPDEAQVARWLADIRVATVPGIIRDLALQGLEDCGRLPADFAGKVPPRRAESAGPAKVPAAAAAPPPPSTTEDLLMRMAAPRPVEARRALVDELARRFAEEWDDPNSLHGFKPKLALAAAGEIPVKAVVSAYRKARKSRDTSKGAIWHWTINAAIGATP